MYDIAILGGGASGLFCGSLLQNKKICIVETNNTVGQKIKISGGGKCNITNKYLDASHFVGDKKLLKQTLDLFDTRNILQYCKQNKITTHYNPKIVEGTYFTTNSQDVIDVLLQKNSHTKFYCNTTVQKVSFFDGYFLIQSDKKTLKAKKIIVATGGLSYPQLGASDIGYRIAQSFGHTVVPTKPALVGFTVQKDEFWFKSLSGTSIKNIAIRTSSKTLKGDFLFTHKGCSGPVVLNSSLYWEKGDICIDFEPTPKHHLPKRVRQALLQSQKQNRAYTMAPAGNFGYKKAEVTKGGVSTDEIDHDSFESRHQKGLYFVGEVLDVTGELGGYNIHWALSSAYCCSKNLQKTCIF